ncbi:MAG: preprotein translocase subunit SecE [Firmicutes bacterium]|jgi:preprotein translocase subunit SecE|nr:preprotein translocase subunit SecE [Bacillota bacterium]HPU01674.1 preprotein translocase subunit SecE [Bacillota bacterium]
MKAIKKLVKYLREVRLEMKKVQWPSRREFTVYTGVVIGTVLAIGLLFWGLDAVFLRILQLVIKR